MSVDPSENVVRYGRDVKLCPPDRVPRVGETITTRVFAKSISDYVIDENGCWVWQKSLTKHGYACATKFKPYRAYFQRANPDVDIAGLDIHHKCHNRACVNPDHLEPVEHGQHLSAHRRAESRFTEQDIIDIRSSKDSMKVLAERYGVPEGTIGNIWHPGAWWKGIGPDRPPRFCAWCNAEITTGTRKKRYCNDLHKARAQRARQGYKTSPERWQIHE